MKDPIEPLTADLADLFAREARAYPEDATRKAEVLARVEMAIALVGPTGGPTGGGPGGAAPAPVTGGATAKAVATKALGAKVAAAVVASFVAGGAVGGGAAMRYAARSHDATVAPQAMSPSAIPSPIPTPSAPPSPAPTQAPTPPPVVAPSPSISVSARGDLARERELLDAARAALGRGRPEDAIAAAERHAQKWPHGYLGEERDVVWIQALVAAGRREDAERKAAQFRKSYPRSMLTPAVDAALAPAP